jgi:hypothetical protein
MCDFRFERHHISFLAEKLGLPLKIVTTNRYAAGIDEALVMTLYRLRFPSRRIDICPNRYAAGRDEALMMTLYRLRFPSRLIDIWRIFGCTEARVSEVVLKTVEILFDGHKDRLKFDARWITPRLQNYVDAIRHKNPQCDRIWGFIDGNLCQTARPMYNQRVMYNGH